ncbi:hypothetical protein [Paenibacillus glycanilyticus]|uniref:Uncharacterized protein n=1 Tax=Paenibacillus glycanilyticus TaxID=126569 RepID=A0ABQ6GID2_9BACL|nr:hypothetical protein [Paenibacillus glycanilyticus]GLX70260.1 hypothetical protein MU1_46060 [Paenibacillus glycanilyticus]
MEKRNVIVICLAVLLVACLIGSKDKSFEHTIDKKLHLIVNPKDSHVKFSSSPYAYIQAEESRDDYNYIVSHGEKSLEYLLHKFAGSNDNGLQEYIMALACADILKEDPASKDWASGREWYNDWLLGDKR